MRVGFDARWYNDSGVGSYVAGLVRAMAVARIDLVVYADARNPVPGLDSLPVSIVPVRAPKYSLAEQLELGRRTREDKLDIFHSPFFVMPLLLSCPVVVTVHDLIPFLFRIYSWPKQSMVRAGYRVAARQARHIIAVSRNTARDVQELLRVTSDRVTCVYNAVSQDCFHPDTNFADCEVLADKYGIRVPYVVSASARNWRTKNLETALEAIAQAHRKGGMEFQTVVYGPPKGISALGVKDRWPDLNLSQTGYIPACDLGALFRHARAFIMPSLYEGFGLPILEAMSCGCPIVTSNAGSLPEVAGSGAQVFDPSDVGGMAAAIAALVSRQKDRERWSAAALRRAADFSWKETARQTISVYHRIHNQFSSAQRT